MAINTHDIEIAIREAYQSREYKDMECLIGLRDRIRKEEQHMQPAGAGTPIPQNNHWEPMVYDYDPRTDEKTTRISVKHLIERCVGNMFYVQVREEKWDHLNPVNVTSPGDYCERIIAIHLRRKDTGEFITLRESYDKFPSLELTAKLELLRI
jgi:hypothetical protein